MASCTAGDAAQSTPKPPWLEGPLTPMFASLRSVAVTPPDTKVQLTQNWYEIIRKWYPDFQHKVYCVPPVHLYGVSYKPKTVAPDMPEPYERFGFYMYDVSQLTAIRDDEAQQRVLRTFKTYLKKEGRAAFVLSNVEFQNFLNKEYECDNWDDDLPKLKLEEGEVDVLIIDKSRGIFVIEMKSTGDCRPGQTEEDRLLEFKTPFGKLTKQLPKQVEVIRQMIEDLDPNGDIKIMKGAVLPNFKRELLRKALVKLPLVTQDLLNMFKVQSNQELEWCFLCCDDMSQPNTTGTDTVDECISQNVHKFLETLLDITPGKMQNPISDDDYEKIIARFCGPLTTVKVYTEKTMPRVRLAHIAKKSKQRNKKKQMKDPLADMKMIPFECRTLAGAARELARRFSELVLMEEQIELLQHPEEFVHIEGPPGTGKTLMLLLRILTWLEDEGRENMVWILSLAPPSRSVTHVLMEQVKMMLKEHKGEQKAKVIIKEKLRHFIVTRPEHTLDAKYYERKLHKWRLRAKLKDSQKNWGYPRPPTLPPARVRYDKRVCLVLDETGMTGKGLNKFFDQVGKCHREGCFTTGDFTAGLSVWSASLEKCGRPPYVRNPEKEPNKTAEKFGLRWKLKMPLRCPPTVQRALMVVQPSLDGKNVFLFKPEHILPHPAGPNVNLKSKGADAKYQYHADGLPVYLIAHGSHEKAHEEIWDCRECGEDLVKYLKEELRIGSDEAIVSDVPLMCKDVMIIATQGAFRSSLSVGEFMVPLVKNKIKLAVNALRDEGDAPIPKDDIILINDIKSIHGLERAVIIVISEHPEIAKKRKEEASNDACEEAPMDTDIPAENSSSSGDDDTLSVATTSEDVPAEEETDGVKMEGMQVEDTTTDGFVEDETLQETSIVAVHSEIMEPEECVPSSETSTQHVVEVEPCPQSQNLTEDTVYAMSSSSPDSVQQMPSCSEQSPSGGQPSKCYDGEFSQRHIEAAMNSLTKEARQDIFYIGSRAVCQLIVIHFGTHDP